jgi:hypothetical protein
MNKRKIIYNYYYIRNKKIKYEDYPIDIIYHILDFVDYKSALNCILVCKSWNYYFKIYPLHIKDDTVINFNRDLDKYSHINRLKIVKGFNYIFLQKFNRLKHIIFENISPIDIFLNNFKREYIYRMLNGIESITLDSSYKGCNTIFFNQIIGLKFKTLIIKNKDRYCYKCYKCCRLLDFDELILINCIGLNIRFFNDLKNTKLKKLKLINCDFVFLLRDDEFNSICDIETLEEFTVSRNMVDMTVNYKKIFNNKKKKIIIK